MTVFLVVQFCANCNKQLTNIDEKLRLTECPECLFHSANGTRTIVKYNEWLKGNK